MIVLTAKIHLVDDKAIESASVRGGGESNISGGRGLTSNATPRRPFIFGASKFGEGYTFSDKLDYYVGGVACNENGEFVTESGDKATYEIRIVKGEASSITVNFDTADNQFPRVLSVAFYDSISNTISSETFHNDDPSFTIMNISEDVYRISIEFGTWNKPFFPAKIESVFVRSFIEVGRTNILSMNAKNADRDSASLPSYGLVSNSSSIEFRDTDGEVADYAEMGTLTKGLKVEMFIENTLNKRRKDVYIAPQRVATGFTNDWEYDFDSRVVRVGVSDGLEEWQNITVPSQNFDLRKGDISQKMSWFYTQFQAVSEKSKVKARELEDLDEKTQTALKAIVVGNPLVEECSLWTAFAKLCVACSLHMSVGSDGIATPHYYDGD